MSEDKSSDSIAKKAASTLTANTPPLPREKLPDDLQKLVDN